MYWLIPILILVAYLLGSIPFGLLIVKVRTGQDIRQIESGRTGGTNAMRAGGCLSGILTAVLDAFKATLCAWLARAIFPELSWLHVIMPIAAILGHNYSVFLIERDVNGRVRFRGGAGGASTVGGAVGLWFPSLIIVVPLAAAILFFIGFASVATLSVAFISILIFAYRAWIGASPWVYVLYGVLAEIILIWALRPNIRRLFRGEERIIGWRAKRRKAKEALSSQEHPS